MNLDEVSQRLLPQGLAFLPMAMDSQKARLLLMAIGLQESRFVYRAQVVAGGGKGPARGFWQFERGGGVRGVMQHHSTTGHAHNVCAARQVPWDADLIWYRLEFDDLLACAFARLLLYSDPRPLPELDDAQGAWEYYERNWRPGKPHRHTWDAFHAQARAEL